MGKGEIGNEFKGFLWFMVRLEVLAARFLGWSVEWMVMFLLSHCHLVNVYFVILILLTKSTCFSLQCVSLDCCLSLLIHCHWAGLSFFFFFFWPSKKAFITRGNQENGVVWAFIHFFFFFLSSSTSSHLILKPGPTLPSQNTISVTQLQCSRT